MPAARNGQPVPPCAEPTCRDPLGGRVSRGCLSPTRLSGARFGVDGLLCHACYNRHANDRVVTAARAAGGRVRLTKWDRAGVRPLPPPASVVPPAVPPALRALAERRAHRADGRAHAPPRRPCPASPRGGHRLVQTGDDPAGAFVCADCGWVWWPPDPWGTPVPTWPASKRRAP